MTAVGLVVVEQALEENVGRRGAAFEIVVPEAWPFSNNLSLESKEEVVGVAMVLERLHEVSREWCCCCVPW